MLRLGTVRFRAKCVRHPRYNPAIDGEAAIKGGCPKCHLLLDIYLAHKHLVGLMRQVKDTQQNTASASIVTTQMELFAELTKT
jgi:hypothetical protein